jgi:hypothetical protein
VTDKDLKSYDTLLKSTVGVRWTNEDVQRLVDEVRRLHSILKVERPVALRNHWVGMPRFIGGH